jgi:L-asparaginase II
MQFELLAEVTRGPLVESRHFGALAVVDSDGAPLHSVGDPGLVAYLRSSAKPLQATVMVASGAADAFGLTPAEIAVISASHRGEDFHTSAVTGILRKLGLDESALACGIDGPGDEATARRLIVAGEPVTALHCDCSGKHAGMLALALHMGAPIQGYYLPGHPVQRRILDAVASMCGMETDAIVLGVDGCGVPVFGLPLRSAALAFARLAEPSLLPPEWSAAAARVTAAMEAHPEMVAGTNRFDTDLMRQMAPRLFCKGGAEGYQAVGVHPNPAAGRPRGIGLAMKIADGDPKGRARHVAVLQALRDLRVLSGADEAALAEYGAPLVTNHRGEIVGYARAAFALAKQEV